jgi:hypothetical protein
MKCHKKSFCKKRVIFLSKKYLSLKSKGYFCLIDAYFHEHFIFHCRSYCDRKGFIDAPIPGKVFSAKWKYLKSYAKQKASKHKTHQKGTGGGRPGPPLSPNTMKIMSVVDNEVELTSAFDSESSSVRRSDILSESVLQTGIEQDRFMTENVEFEYR